MFQKLCVIALMVLSFQAQASGLEIPSADRNLLEAKIFTALKSEVDKMMGTPGKLTDFAVDWSPSSLQCLLVESEFDPTTKMGVCKVDTSAFQVAATAAIIKKYDGYRVVIIHADVE